MLSSVFFVGCNESSQNPIDTDYEAQLQKAKAQLEIVKIMIPSELSVSLSSATQVLTEYYPMLFKQKDVDALFDYYARMTWHTSIKNKESLKSEIDEHADFQKIKKLYQEKILPLQDDDPYPEYRIVDMKINFRRPNKGTEGVYLVNASYELYKKNNTITLPVELEIPENTEFFSQLFNSDDREPHDYGVPDNELSKVKREIITLLIGRRDRTLTVDELTSILDYGN